MYYSDVNDAVTAFVKRSRQVDVETMKLWNAENMITDVGAGYSVSRSGYVSADIILLRGPSMGDWLSEPIVAGLPHATHTVLRPAVLAEDFGAPIKPSVIKPYHDDDVTFLQEWYDDKMPIAGIYVGNDQLIVENCDINISVDKISIDPTKGIYSLPRFDKLKPVLNTAMGGR